MANISPGHIHPLTQLSARIVKYLGKLGFEVMEGPDITTEWYNFDSLRIPADHPARDTQDTFWTKDKLLLRTHTSAMQVPAARTKKPPFRIVIPGRVYRNEATDATHEATIYQLEGFAVAREISMANLVWLLEKLLQEILGKNIETRFYPHHYPFVEPGMDVMIKWRGRWLEILGSGMIHPAVIKNMGLNPSVWQGLAFGIGVDRLMMLERHIDEIRLSYSNDLRFLKQF